jgi:AraC family transcriptional regulator, ethanolamine operon transcriptional activator
MDGSAGIRTTRDTDMTRTVFSDFDEFADSIRGIAGRFVPTARSEQDWWVEASGLGRVELQQLQIGGASTYAGDGTPNTLTLGIPMSDPKRIRIDGHALEDDSLIYLKRDQPFTFASRQATRWAGVTIGLNGANAGPKMFDAEQVMATLAPGTRAQSNPHHLDRLRHLVSRISIADGSVGFHDPAASSAAEEEVLAVVLQTIEASTATQDRHVGRPQVSRNRVIARTLALIDAQQGKPMFIDDLCRATEVSERTLRNVFHEYFGVGPMRLLKVRQLLEIRAALLAADPAHDTVARLAASFGVWDFSLFARNYKALYGESPSESLRRPPPKSDGSPGASWIAHAARMFIDFDVGHAESVHVANMED